MQATSHQPKISVVTVAFNSDRTLRETIDSVLGQTYPNIEYIVVDGGSTDRTMSIVGEYADRIDVVVSEKDDGIYDAMNKGLRLASGDVVGFLNSDDQFANADALNMLAQAWDENTDLVYGDLIFVDSQAKRAQRYWKSSEYEPGACLAGWAPPHPTLYVKRSILLACGGFKTNYRFTADFELILRLFEVHKVRTKYVPYTFVHMRIGGATTASLRNIWKANLEASRACRENHFPGGWKFILGKLMRKLPQVLMRGQARHSMKSHQQSRDKVER